MKIGIFGGCFNPPHKMHEKIVKELLNILDKIIVVPTGGNYNKKDLVKPIDRYNMLKLVFDDKRIEVSDYELDKTPYSYQTLDYFQSIYPNDTLYFITGSDNFQKIESWKNWEYLLKQYHFIIVKRGEYKLNISNKKVEFYDF